MIKRIKMIIKSRHNEKVKLYNKLKNLKKHRDSSGLVCLEGLRLVCDVEQFNITSLFITDKCYKKNKAKLETVVQTVKNVYFVDDNVAEYMSDVKASQGIFAIVKNPAQDISKLILQKKGLYICLSEISDPSNMGAIVRTAAGLGFWGVIINDCCDMFSLKAMRSSMGAAFKIPIYICKNVSEIFANKDIKSYASVAYNEDIHVYSNEFSTGVLFVGNEANGLSGDIIEKSLYRVKIPIHNQVESLNVAVAASLCMYEMARTKREE